MDDVKTARSLCPLIPTEKTEVYCKVVLPKIILSLLNIKKLIKSNLIPFQQSVALPELPAVVVFKDGGYFTYDGKLTYMTYIFILF